MSATTAAVFSGARSISSGGWPAMPSDRRVDEQIGLVRASCGNSRPDARASSPRPNRAASASARARGAIDDRDALDAARQQRVDDRARRAAGAQDDGGRGLARASPARSASRLARKPATSVLSPHSAPSSRHSVLTAPDGAARPRSSRSQAAKAASLCGTVTLAPTRPSRRSRRRKRRNPPGGTANRS